MNKMKKLITAIMVPSLVLFSGSMLAKSEQGQKVLLCHNGHEINVSVHALDAHLRNHEDDNVGECAGGDGSTCVALAVEESIISDLVTATVTFSGFLCPTTDGTEVSASEQLSALLLLPLSDAIVADFPWELAEVGPTGCDPVMNDSGDPLESGGILVEYSYFCQLVGV